jgi:voltage-gated potassium channel Kch
MDAVARCLRSGRASGSLRRAGGHHPRGMLVLDVLAVAAGVLGLLVLAADVAITILHPATRGPLSSRVNRLVWWAMQRAARGRRERTVLSFGGPAAIVATLLVWLLGTGLAFALIYWPFVESLVDSSGEPVQQRGFLEALYLSGTSLSTVGFGDVVAQSDLLQLVTVVESMSGLVAVTSAITYLLSVTPYALDVRNRAVQLAELGAVHPEGAARLAVQGGASAVAEVHAALVQAHENLRRFPVLFLFEPRDPEASLLTLLRAATSMCLVLRWGIRPGTLPFAELYGEALQSTLGRVREDYGREFPALAPGPDEEELEGPAADARLRAMRDAVAAGAPGHEAPSGRAPEAFTAFLEQVDPLLAALSRVYRYEARPLLEPRA